MSDASPPTNTSPTDTASQPLFEPPFILEYRYENLQLSGTFTPQAALLLTPGLTP
jgi:hypothetical protein